LPPPPHSPPSRRSSDVAAGGATSCQEIRGVSIEARRPTLVRTCSRVAMSSLYSNTDTGAASVSSASDAIELSWSTAVMVILPSHVTAGAAGRAHLPSSYPAVRPFPGAVAGHVHPVLPTEMT